MNIQNENNENQQQESGSRDLPRISKVVSRELEKVKHILYWANQEPHKEALADRGLDQEFLDGMQTGHDGVSAFAYQALFKTTLKEKMTSNEKRIELELIKAVQEVQSSARLKYRLSAPEIMHSYFTGESLHTSHARLDFIVASILLQLSEDNLPGITDEKVTALQTLHGAWDQADWDQDDAQLQASIQRFLRDDNLKILRGKRIDIQLAINAEYPYQDKENEAVRRLFLLPINRPYVA